MDSFGFPERISFNRDIRPILSDNCFACHGPAAKDVKGDVRLDVRELAIVANKEGRIAIVPGKPEASEIIRRIHMEDGEKRMPPADSHKTLTAEQKALLTEWVKQGAVWGDHWAFVPPKKPALPAVKRAGWAVNPIDVFVLTKLEAAGLSPSAEADRATLIRRVSYDLTGLPPTPAEVDAFVKDTSSDAYEAMVDRYLAKPAFGERMALAWMDAARYGDTSALHADGHRDMWAWRDWVIKSYNDNMPFDRFTVEQIAGDLIPDADAWQKAASGFNRNNGTSDEGGAIPEELRVEYAIDRVKTTSNVWLALSMECAQCHDHKYDPITQRDYYAFYAFFNQASDPGMQTRKGNSGPVVSVPDLQNAAQVADLQAKVAEIDAATAAHARSVDASFAKWAAEEAARVAETKTEPLPADMLVHFPLDETGGEATACAINDAIKGSVTGKPAWQAGKIANAFATSAETFVSFPADVANFDADNAFSYGCWVKSEGDGAVVAKMDTATAYRGWDLFLQNGGQLAMHLIHTWPSDAIKVSTHAKVKRGEWTHVFVTYDGSFKSSGVKLYINGVEQAQRSIEADTLKSTTQCAAPLDIGRRHTAAQFKGIVDDVRIYSRALAPAEVERLAVADPIAPILATPAAQRSPQQIEQLRAHYLSTVDPVQPKLQKDRAAILAEIQKLQQAATTVMVMQDEGKGRETFLLVRGNYASPDKEGGVIQPAIPPALGKLPEGAPANRLGLARWIVQPDHPLTSRVAVNRYWYFFFGRGLVGTVMDFGSQGEFPTHPELLDWLAVDFVEHGWDRKRTIKQILMSATYRQSSVMTPALASADPENLLLARGPRFRLQGEFIRDTALSVSGLLVDHVGGPSVKPYQPPGLWEAVGFDARFVQDRGEKLYRKSMYIYWKRSAPHPGMILLDAPTREKCTVDRARTNTPLQALYTMNDTQFIEASRVMAERIIAEGGTTPASRIAFAHRLTTAREPGERTAAALLRLYEQELARFRSEPERARQLLAHGEHPRNDKLDPAEHAAWTMVASTLLNIDATLTRS